MDGVTVVRYGQPFRRTVCKTELAVTRFWLYVVLLIGMTLAFFAVRRYGPDKFVELRCGPPRLSVACLVFGRDSSAEIVATQTG
jgi:hypothetical protein